LSFRLFPSALALWSLPPVGARRPEKIVTPLQRYLCKASVKASSRMLRNLWAGGYLSPFCLMLHHGRRESVLLVCEVGSPPATKQTVPAPASHETSFPGTYHTMLPRR
jgi:hypothetical protein